MNRIRLIRLSVTGPNLPPAEIEFGPRLTVVHGASNTGKTYIFDAIDYLLGASEIRQIDEAEEYATASLSIETQLKQNGVTFERALRGKSSGVKVYEGLRRSGRPTSLSVRHSNTSKNNVSAFLLSQVGLVDKWVRTNEQNETHSLSFRNLAGLTLIGEAKIVSRTPAPFSGQFTTRTKEQSVLKILLQGDDDSNLPRTTKVAVAERQRDQGRLAALEQVASEIRMSLAGGESPALLRERGERLQSAIDDVTGTLGSHIQQQVDLAQGQREVQNEYTRRHARLAELNDLTANFQLLARKYDSDLERLAMLEEAGTLLGYFDVGDCVFCGSTPEYQSVAAHRVEDRSLFAASVHAEQAKTRALREDLVFAIGDLVAEKERELAALSLLDQRQATIKESVRQLDEQIAPQQSELSELLLEKGMVERRLAAYEQIERVDELRAAVPSHVDAATTAATSISSRVASEFSETLAGILNAWGVPELVNVSFDSGTGEMSMNGVPRATHGKGMRAILHAAFTVGLAQWCIERDLPHPGFVILDSPLLTYKEPEAEDARLVESNVSAHFFRYLSSAFSGQAVVLENVAPPLSVKAGSSIYEFTKGSQGRYGLFPRGLRDG